MIKNFIKVFFILDILVIVVCFTQENTLYLPNTQIAFLSSLFITLGSYLGYKKNIEKRVKTYDTNFDEPDTIDQIDDKFDLYSPINDQEELSKEEIQEILKEEKQKLKNQSNIKNTFQSIGAISSVYRVVGYISLVVGFFYLRNNHLFEPISYLIGFLIVPIGVLISNIIYKKSSI